MKKILSVLLVLLLAIGALGATAFAEEYPALSVKEDGALRVGFLVQNLESEYNRRCHQAMQVEAAHRGWDLTICVVNSDEERVAALNTLINKEVDAIVISNMDMPAMATYIDNARNAGIGVYNCDTEVLPGCISNALACNGAACAKMAYVVGEDLGWNAKYAVITIPSLQVHGERVEPIKAVFNQYSGMEMVAEEYVSFGDVAVTEQAYNYMKRWCEKFGDTIDLVVGSWDGAAIGAANAIADSFDDSDCITMGIDGGSEVWAYIRNGSNVKYSYAQPVELYYHVTCELVDQLQVQGMQPGDEGCMIGKWGEAIYCDGEIITPDNVPNVGESVHAAINYYGGDPADAGAWYNWTEAGGYPMVEDN